MNRGNDGRRPAPEGGGGVEIHQGREGVVLAVRVQPRASRDAIGGARGGALLVRLTAPPVDGAANAALARLLGRTLGVAPGAVRIAGGVRGRTKRVVVSGIDLAAARERLRVLERGREGGSEGEEDEA